MTAVLTPRVDAATAPVPGRRRRPRSSPSRGPLALLALAVIANLVVGLDLDIPVVRPGAGLFLLLGLPTYLVLATKTWIRSTPIDAVLCSFAAALLAVIVGGLAANELLPMVGVSRPLDRVPMLLVTDVALLVVVVTCRGRWHAERTFRRRAAGRLRRLGAPDRRVMTAAVLVVVAAVAGAIRLNNGLGGGLTMIMLCGAAGVLVALLAWRRRLRPGTVVVTIYLLSLALLLMTSLRGWGIAGHDSQVEFYVYQLTKDLGVWRMDSFQSAYNACLSITVLPTILSGITGISGAYVFKLLFPMIFASCPVMVYLIARRYASPLVAVLAAMFFISFPTYFTDMPFLNRQAIAFVFLGLVVLVITNARWAVQRRQLWVAAMSVGVVLAHYSTTYVLIGTLAAALGVRIAVTLGERLLARLRPGRPRRRVDEPRVVGVANIVLLALLAVFWTGPATHSGGQIEQTATQLVSVFAGRTQGAQSSDVSYSVVKGAEKSAEQKLQDYVNSVVDQTAPQRAQGLLFPVDVVSRYPTPVAGPVLLPLTAVGGALASIGVDVNGLNTVMRLGVAQLLQILVCIGLVVVVFRRAWGMHASRELVFLATGSLMVIAAQVLIPNLSVDYGVLRAFQQALFVMAPFLAVGSLAVVGWLGARRSAIAAGGIAIFCFLSLTGVIPQALGGYGPQLHLNNSGEYYDLYYPLPEEAAAADWVEQKLLAAGQGTVQTQIPGRLLYGLTSDIGVDRAIHPATIRPQDYVLLGATTVIERRATVQWEGDRLAYEYPLSLLDQNMDLVYNDGKARIYR